MRFALVVPHLNKNNKNFTKEIAEHLILKGHDVSLMVKNRVRLIKDGQFHLGDNSKNIEDLERILDPSDLFFFHSNVSREKTVSEDLLNEIDLDCFKEYFKVYSPDFVLFFDSQYLPSCDHTRKILSSIKEKILYFKYNNEKQYFESSFANGTFIKIGGFKSSSLFAQIEKWQISKFGKESKVQSLKKIQENKHLFANLPDAPIQKNARIESNKAISSGNVDTPPILGEIESFKSGDVIFGGKLWIKGWIDCRYIKVKYLKLIVNSREHVISLGTVRGDIAVTFSSSDFCSFSGFINIDYCGSQVHFESYVHSQDGKSIKWKSAQLWVDNSIPVHPSTEIILGEVSHTRISESITFSGHLFVSNRLSYKLKAVQFGECVGEWEGTHLKNGSSIEFSFQLNERLDLRYPTYLWVDFGQGWRFWTRHEILLNGHDSNSFEGDVGQILTNGDSLNLDGFSKSKIFINGEYAAGTGGGKMKVPGDLPSLNNSLFFEAIGSLGDYKCFPIWLHSPSGPARKLKHFSVPSESIISPPRLTKGRFRSRIILIRRAPAPTDELYILAPLQKLESEGKIILEVVDCGLAGFNLNSLEGLLQGGVNVIVSRYVPDQVISLLTQKKGVLGKVFYLMDDDVLAAEDTPWLPESYRRRMMGVAHGEFQSMVTLCDTFIVTSESLLSKFNSKKTKLLEPPFLHSKKRDVTHFDSKKFIIAYHGTLNHRDDVAFISPALKKIHDKYSHVNIQIVMGNKVPNYLKSLSRVEIVKSMSWDEYKNYSKKCRSHVGLSPILNTPYNSGKSIIKIHDISSLGAVGVYSNSDPYRKFINSSENGLLVENDPIMWQKALSWLVEHPEEARLMAKKGIELSERIGALSILQDWWVSELQLTHPN